MLTDDQERRDRVMISRSWLVEGKAGQTSFQQVTRGWVKVGGLFVDPAKLEYFVYATR